MKVVILCGGKGSRLRAANDDTPMPLALVNGKPILWHIMKIYSSFGYNDFILPLGFGGEQIKEFFWDYEWKHHDFIKDTSSNKVIMLQQSENWNITFVDTGIETMTGARIKKIEKYVDGDTFMLTYGDGLSDINIDELVKYHYDKGKIATVTGISRDIQYGILSVKDGVATSFEEKPPLDGVINGGFFVLNKEIFSRLSTEESCIFEREPMQQLAQNGELAVYEHKGFWMAIDTYKDLLTANESWKPTRY